MNLKYNNLKYPGRTRKIIMSLKKTKFLNTLDQKDNTNQFGMCIKKEMKPYIKFLSKLMDKNKLNIPINKYNIDRDDNKYDSGIYCVTFIQKFLDESKTEKDVIIKEVNINHNMNIIL